MTELPYGRRQCHLLWALMFLKCYNTVDYNASVVNVDRKTFRKWCWAIIHSLANLTVVRFYSIPFSTNINLKDRFSTASFWHFRSSCTNFS